VHPAVLVTCPVQNHKFLKRLAVRCQGCFQEVDPGCLARHRCRSCRHLTRITAAGLQQRAAGDVLSQAHPWLRQASQLSGTEQWSSWLLQCRYQHARWRLVLASDSGDVLQVARSAGWWRSWQPVEKSDWPEFLAGHPK
jgi:hypothetical protein